MDLPRYVLYAESDAVLSENRGHVVEVEKARVEAILRVEPERLPARLRLWAAAADSTWSPLSFTSLDFEIRQPEFAVVTRDGVSCRELALCPEFRFTPPASVEVQYFYEGGEPIRDHWVLASVRASNDAMVREKFPGYADRLPHGKLVYLLSGARLRDLGDGELDRIARTDSEGRAVFSPVPVFSRVGLLGTFEVDRDGQLPRSTTDGTFSADGYPLSLEGDLYFGAGEPWIAGLITESRRYSLRLVASRVPKLHVRVMDRDSGRPIEGARVLFMAAPRTADEEREAREAKEHSEPQSPYRNSGRIETDVDVRGDQSFGDMVRFDPLRKKMLRAVTYLEQAQPHNPLRWRSATMEWIVQTEDDLEKTIELGKSEAHWLGLRVIDADTGKPIGRGFRESKLVRARLGSNIWLHPLVDLAADGTAEFRGLPGDALELSGLVPAYWLEGLDPGIEIDPPIPLRLDAMNEVAVRVPPPERYLDKDWPSEDD